MESFSELSARTARTLVGTPEEWFDINHKFYDGDHWQDGAGFADPVPPPSSAIAKTVREGIQRIFVAVNHVREITKRRTDGVLARPPKWEFQQRATPQDSTEETHGELSLPEITLPMRTWWEKRGIHGLMKESITEASLSKDAILRIYIPPGRLIDGEVNAKTLSEALDHIYVDMIKTDRAAIYTEEWSMRDVAVAIFNGRTFTDPVSSSKKSDYSDYAEVTYVAPNGQTIHRLTFDDMRPDRQAEYDLGGRMLMFRVGDLLLITEQIRQLQKTISTTATHMAINNRETNFQQRVFMNAQEPGSIELDEETGKVIITPTDIERGSDVDLWVKGVEVERLDGTIDLKTPDLRVINPTDPRSYIESMGEYRRDLYREAKQLHIELIKDSTATGESRLQAVADFEQDLNDAKEVADATGRWILETSYAMALQLIGDQIPDDIKARFDAQITVGPIPVEKRRALVEEYKGGVRSLFSTMSEGGVENPEEEIRRIRDDIEWKVRIADLRGKAIQSYTTAGVDLEAAARLAGLSEDEIEILLQVDVERKREMAELNQELFDTDEGDDDGGDETDSGPDEE